MFLNMPSWLAWVQRLSGLIKRGEEAQVFKVEINLFLIRECSERANINNGSKLLKDNGILWTVFSKAWLLGKINNHLLCS